MVTKLVFTINREVLQFAVKEKVVFYTDRRWKNWIRVLPENPQLVMKVKMSRNKIPHELIRLFTLTVEEKREYENAKDEKEMCDIIIKDARLKGCRLLKRMEVEGEQESAKPNGA